MRILKRLLQYAISEHSDSKDHCNWISCCKEKRTGEFNKSFSFSVCSLAVYFFGTEVSVTFLKICFLFESIVFLMLIGVSSSTG